MPVDAAPAFRPQDPTMIANAQDAALARLNAEGGSVKGGALKDFLRSLAHKTPFVGTFSDEIRGAVQGAIPGGMGYAEARDAERQKLADMQLLNPGTDKIMGIGGAALVPASFGRGLLGNAAKSGAGKIATGGLLGGAQAGSYAFGEAEGGLGERGKAAVLPTIFGTAVGAAVPAAVEGAKVLPRIMRRGSTGQAVASELENASGVSRDIGKLTRSLDDEVKDIQAKHFQKLEEKYKVIKDPDILNVLSDPEVQRLAPRTIAGAKKGAAPGPFGGDKRAWSYKDIVGKDALLSKLRKAAKTDAGMQARLEDLNAALKNLDGHSEAMKRYGPVMDKLEAIDDGRAMVSASQFDLQQATKNMDPVTRRAFNTGRMFEIVEKLEKRNDEAVSLLRDYLDAGSSTRRSLRELFQPGKTGDAAFKEFETVLRKERSAEKVASALKSRWTLGAGAAGAYGSYKIFKD
jgi:hypothetical protein